MIDPAAGPEEAEEARQKPKRNDNKSAKNDVPGRCFDCIKAERGNPISEPDDCVIQIIGIEAKERENNPNDKRGNHKLQNYKDRATAEKAFHAQVRFLH